jgi:hypothetical protein
LNRSLGGRGGGGQGVLGIEVISFSIYAKNEENCTEFGEEKKGRLETLGTDCLDVVRWRVYRLGDKVTRQASTC